eukprot:10914.XXX_194361_194489_1 [CDS] Oithona nana genome sequencing.
MMQKRKKLCRRWLKQGHLGLIGTCTACQNNKKVGSQLEGRQW